MRRCPIPSQCHWTEPFGFKRRLPPARPLALSLRVQPNTAGPPPANYSAAAGLGGVKRSLAELLEQACNDPLGHAPDDGILELVGLDQAGIAGDIQPDWMVGARVDEMVDRDPFGGGHLGVERQHRPHRGQEHEGPDRYRWEDGRSRDHVIEGSSQMLAVQLDSDFFLGLTDRGCEEIRVSRLAAAARQSHVAAPGISGALGAPDQKDAIGFGNEDDGDCGP
jgi:hypothetical protein